MPNPATHPAPGDVTAPAVPSAPVVVPYGKGLQISVVGYTPPNDFFRYRYYKGGALWRESPTLSQIDYDVNYGTTYQYTVAAIDTAQPPNASAQSGIGSGIPVTYDTPDIKPGAVSAISYAYATPGGSRNSSQPNALLPGMVVTHTLTASSNALVVFTAHFFDVFNNTGVVQRCGIAIAIIRDGTTTIALSSFEVPLSGTSPGQTGRLPFEKTVVDVPGPGAHTYTVSWQVVSESSSVNVTGFATGACLLEVTELKR